MLHFYRPDLNFTIKEKNDVEIVVFYLRRVLAKPLYFQNIATRCTDQNVLNESRYVTCDSMLQNNKLLSSVKNQTTFCRIASYQGAMSGQKLIGEADLEEVSDF